MLYHFEYELIKEYNTEEDVFAECEGYLRQVNQSMQLRTQNIYKETSSLKMCLMNSMH